MKLNEIIKRQNDYLRNTGGVLALRESDDNYNDMNREQIVAFKDQYGAAFLGNINFYGKDGKLVVAGEKSVYVEYVGQMVYNFGCDFCVPCADEALAEMIRSWNTPGSLNRMTQVEKITNKIEELGGINFIWY